MKKSQKKTLNLREQKREWWSATVTHFHMESMLHEKSAKGVDRKEMARCSENEFFDAKFRITPLTNISSLFKFLDENMPSKERP